MMTLELTEEEAKLLVAILVEVDIRSEVEDGFLVAGNHDLAMKEMDLVDRITGQIKG